MVPDFHRMVRMCFNQSLSRVKAEVEVAHRGQVSNEYNRTLETKFQKLSENVSWKFLIIILLYFRYFYAKKTKNVYLYKIEKR